jgi:hypothetical protein
VSSAEGKIFKKGRACRCAGTLASENKKPFQACLTITRQDRTGAVYSHVVILTDFRFDPTHLVRLYR